MQLLGHQTSFQSSTCLRINEITSGIDGESQKRHRRAIFIEEQVRMRAETKITGVVRGQKGYRN